MLLPGDGAPFFHAASSVNPVFSFDTVAGRYVVISFFGSSQVPSSQQFLSEIAKRGDRFDVSNAIFFGVTNDPKDVERLKHEHPGRIYFYDLDLAVSKKFGVIEESPAAPAGGQAPANGNTNATLARRTFVLDPALRVVGAFGMGDDDAPRQVEAMFSLLDSLPR